MYSEKTSKYNLPLYKNGDIPSLRNDINKASNELENKLDTAITDEITRATNAETALDTKIDDETERATTRENELDTKINTKSTVKIFTKTVNAGSIAGNSAKDITIEFNLTDNDCPNENTIACQRGTTAREVYLKRINTYKSGNVMKMLITFTNTASFQIDNISTTIQYLQIK